MKCISLIQKHLKVGDMLKCKKDNGYTFLDSNDIDYDYNTGERHVLLLCGKYYKVVDIDTIIKEVSIIGENGMVDGFNYYRPESPIFTYFDIDGFMRKKKLDMINYNIKYNK